MVDEDDHPKHSYLANLVLVFLLFQNGNSDAERGFSGNKSILEKRTTNIAKDIND